MMKEISDVFSSVFHLAPSSVSAETSQENTPAWDSLGHLRLVIALEQRFGLRFRGDDIPRMTSVAKILEFLQRSQAKSGLM
jgi:acyl carrier protein